MKKFGKDFDKAARKMADSLIWQTKFDQSIKDSLERYGPLGVQIVMAQEGIKNEARLLTKLASVSLNLNMDFNKIHTFYEQIRDSFFPYLGYQYPHGFDVNRINGSADENKILLKALEKSQGILPVFLEEIRNKERSLSNTFLNDLYFSFPKARGKSSKTYTLAQLIDTNNEVYKLAKFIIDEYIQLPRMLTRKSKLEAEFELALMREYKKNQSIEAVIEEQSVEQAYNELESHNNEIYERIHKLNILFKMCKEKFELSIEPFIKTNEIELINDLEQNAFNTTLCQENSNTSIIPVEEYLKNKFNISGSRLEYKGHVDLNLLQELKSKLGEHTQNDLANLGYKIVSDHINFEDCTLLDSDSPAVKQSKENQILASWEALGKFLNMQNFNLKKYDIEIPIKKIIKILKDEYKINPNTVSRTGFKWIVLLASLVKDDYLNKRDPLYKALKNNKHFGAEDDALDIYGFYNAFRGRIGAETLKTSKEIHKLYYPMQNGYLDSRGFDSFQSFTIENGNKQEEYFFYTDSVSKASQKYIDSEKYKNSEKIMTRDSLTNIIRKYRETIKEKKKLVQQLTQTHRKVDPYNIMMKTGLIRADLFKKYFEPLLNTPRYKVPERIHKFISKYFGHKTPKIKKFSSKKN